MAHPSVVKYLRENKDRIPIEQLKSRLAAQGYPADVIAAGVAAVFGASPSVAPPSLAGTTRNFFDLRRPYDYGGGRGRLAHFLVGLILVPSFFYVLGFALLAVIQTIIVTMTRNYFLPGFGLLFILGHEVLYLVLLVYCFRFRRWVFWGMLPSVLMGLMSVFTLYAIFTGSF